MNELYYDFTMNQRPKNKRNKILFLIFLVVVIIVVSFSTYLGIKYAKNNAKSQENIENESNNELAPESNDDNLPNEEVKSITKKIPIYTESGIEKMDKIYSSTPENKRVFLTFDDGPSSNITPLILDILKANNVKATFFTLGSRVVQNPELVKREYEEGHYVANHGYSHVYSSIYASKNTLLDEYNRTEEAIRNAIAVPEYSSHLFRFPGGSVGGKYNSVKKEYKKLLAENEVFYVDWNCLNEDASGNRTKEQLVQYIKKYSENKNSLVVLMHDASDKILTYETLQEVIDYYKENGYTFCNFYDVIDYEEK